MAQCVSFTSACRDSVREKTSRSADHEQATTVNFIDNALISLNVLYRRRFYLHFVAKPARDLYYIHPMFSSFTSRRGSLRAVGGGVLLATGFGLSVLAVAVSEPTPAPAITPIDPIRTLHGDLPPTPIRPIVDR